MEQESATRIPVEADVQDWTLTLHLMTPHADDVQDYVARTFESIRNQR